MSIIGKRFRRHIERICNGRPVCGGGNAGRSAHYQQDIGEPNCARCLSILPSWNQHTKSPKI